jgi:hypothetical protein
MGLDVKKRHARIQEKKGGNYTYKNKHRQMHPSIVELEVVTKTHI